MVYASQPRRAGKHPLPLPRVTMCSRRLNESGRRERRQGSGIQLTQSQG